MLPKLALFDYGQTLIHETGFSSLLGNEALLRFAVKNPEGHTAGEICALEEDLLLYSSLRDENRVHEINHTAFHRLLFENLGMEFSLTPDQMQTVYWDAAAPGEPTPHVREFLAFLAQNDVKIGVLSNLSFRSAVLEERLRRLLPEIPFAFVLASSEYGLRKPCPWVFRAALRRAGVDASDAWYFGDNPLADVQGAAAVGMRPVWYTGSAPAAYDVPDTAPAIPCLHVSDWRELMHEPGFSF